MAYPPTDGRFGRDGRSCPTDARGRAREAIGHGPQNIDQCDQTDPEHLAVAGPTALPGVSRGLLTPTWLPPPSTLHAAGLGCSPACRAARCR